MTRVLMTADAVGGVWTYALELADALNAVGVEVHLAVLGPEPSAAQLRELDASAVASYVAAAYPLEWTPQPDRELAAAGRWLLEQADRVRPDVVHLNGYALAALDWPAPVVVVAHSDVLSWWRAVHGVPAPPEWHTYRDRVRAGLDAAAKVVAPTSAVLADLEREYAFSGGVVVPNCRRRDWVRPTPKEPLVLGAGRAWDEAKNLSLLDRVAPSLPWPVAVAGEGASSSRSLGALPFAQLCRWLLRAAIFVAPARYEPFGLAVLEAAHAGCALVLSDLPSLREVWGDAALYVGADDEDALRTALHDLIAGPQLLGEFGARASQRAKRYSPERTAAGYLEVYRHVRSAVRS
jgi:glycogen synthase